MLDQSYMRARDICYMARPYLRFLMQETGETSNLALVENDELVIWPRPNVQN